MNKETGNAVEEVSQGRPGEPKLCPYCGYNTDINPVPVDEEEVKEYFRRMYAGEPYEKTFKYNKGDISVTLREIPTTKTDILINLVKDIADQDIVLTYAFRSKFMASCVEFKIGEKTIIDSPVEDFGSLEELNALYDKTVGQLPPILSHIADDAMSNFNTLIDSAIQDAITSRDF